jgi:hypothetical protein
MQLARYAFMFNLFGIASSFPQVAESCSVGVFVKKTNQQIHESCSVAQFRSKKSVNFIGKPLLFATNSMCESDTGTEPQSGVVAFVQRGSCSFSEKSRVASRLGYLALVIVNTDPVTFSFGETEDLSESLIPTVMISSTLGQQLSALCGQDGACDIEHLKYGKCLLVELHTAIKTKGLTCVVVFQYI